MTDFEIAAQALHEPAGEDGRYTDEQLDAWDALTLSTLKPPPPDVQAQLDERRAAEQAPTQP